ncbi:phosphatidate cytidylyltransferase [Clostridium ganghwense]|uniref:Phosphatidate cytidylyltransferase n=1 Tax=Clostridium ganghwense TaxID=312089 RepID=A0ABT4CVP2_9CLOT|nr:phosphatidate cytidylyltransferase [Clostridium ganghwense]MCY6372508.1 phosphatidate cytidylyltransferase [Clostridium ganghwense]
MDKRYFGALLLSPLVIVLFMGGIYLKYVVMTLSLFGMYELFRIMKNKNIKPLSIVAYLLCIVYYILFVGKNSVDYKALFLSIFITILLMLCIPIINEKYNFIDISITLFGFFYVTIFFSFIVLVNQKEYGQYLIWIIFISSWLCDTSAYYVGKYFGKNKLCPKVSPKKTIEGSIGGLIGSTIGCGIYGLVIMKQGVEIPLYNFCLIGVFCGVFCQFGDLVASSIKRYVGVKDFSNLIPGHGGILDRFDSILFASTVVYYYITIIMGM